LSLAALEWLKLLVHQLFRTARLDFQVKYHYDGFAVSEMPPMDATVIWEDEPGRNVEHIADNGLTPDEVDEVLLDDAIPTARSHSTSRPCKFGYTSTGKYIIVTWDELCDNPRMIYPVTAYEVPEPF
jgi:hypothetical protein